MSIKLTRAPLELAGVAASSYRSFVGKLVPNLQLAMLDGQAGTALSDCRGKVVVLDFWASWCPTCYPPDTETQEIVRRNPDWADSVEFITVSVDSNRSQAVEIVTEQGWFKTKNMAVDFEELTAIGVSVVPVVVIVDTDGRVATMAGSHSVDIEREVKALLKQAPVEPTDEREPE